MGCFDDLFNNETSKSLLQSVIAKVNNRPLLESRNERVDYWPIGKEASAPKGSSVISKHLGQTYIGGELFNLVGEKDADLALVHSSGNPRYNVVKLSRHIIIDDSVDSVDSDDAPTWTTEEIYVVDRGEFGQFDKDYLTTHFTSHLGQIQGEDTRYLSYNHEPDACKASVVDTISVDSSIDNVNEYWTANGIAEADIPDKVFAVRNGPNGNNHQYQLVGEGLSQDTMFTFDPWDERDNATSDEDKAKWNGIIQSIRNGDPFTLDWTLDGDVHVSSDESFDEDATSSDEDATSSDEDGT